MLLARSAPKGEADEIGAQADIAARTSAVGGKADVTATFPGSPLLVKSGRMPNRMRFGPSSNLGVVYAFLPEFGFILKGRIWPKTLME